MVKTQLENKWHYFYLCKWEEGPEGPDPNDIIFKRIMRKHIPNIDLTDFDDINFSYEINEFHFIIDRKGSYEYTIIFHEGPGELQKYSFTKQDRKYYWEHIDVKLLIYDWRIRFDDSFSIFVYSKYNGDLDEMYILPIKKGLIEDDDFHFCSDLNTYKKAYINTFNYLITTINHQMKDPAKIITKYFNFEHLKTDLI